MKGWQWAVIAIVIIALLWKTRENYATSETAGSAAKSGYDALLKNEGQTVDYQTAPTPQSTTTTTPTTSSPAPVSKPSSGNTTGGSSTSSIGPNSGGGGDRRKQIFGPEFTSIGDGAGDPARDPARDSSKTTVYPKLLGGGETKPTTRIEGAGIVPPSKNWQLKMDGSLPSFGGLGSNEDSKYLPTSRVPGDMEKIADPYRVSQSYSAANYSFKTEPVPFLTDFSAFQK